jgi:hypothetical protein
MNSAYIEVVRLLLEAIPVVFQETQFAMKGGHRAELVHPGSAAIVCGYRRGLHRSHGLTDGSFAADRGITGSGPQRVKPTGTPSRVVAWSPCGRIQIIPSPRKSLGQGGGEPCVSRHDASASSQVPHARKPPAIHHRSSCPGAGHS